MLTDEQLEELRKIYKEKLGKEITKAEALEKGIHLVDMMKTIILENHRQEIISKKEKQK